MSRRRGFRPALALTGVGLLLAIAGCGDSTPAATSTAPSTQTSPGAASSATAQAKGGPPDACRLVTPAEAQSALGKPVRPAKTRLIGPAGAQGATCTSETTDFANGTAAGKALTVTFFPSVSITRSDWDKTWADNTFQAVPGLGDSAWFKGGLLNVWSGGATLAISIVSLQVEATVGQLTPIARHALSRM